MARVTIKVVPFTPRRIQELLKFEIILPLLDQFVKLNYHSRHRIEQRGILQVNSPVYDVAIVGGGVVGCAMARRFTLEGASVVLIEKAPDILAGASKGNSAILHTGFDAKPGSLELCCIREGYREYVETREEFGLPLLRTGGMVVAWNEEEALKLDAMEHRAHCNGVTDVYRIQRSELLEREPNLAPGAVAALVVPRESVIDPWSAPLAHLRQALENGAKTRFGAAVLSGTFSDGVWNLVTSLENIAARTVINCAGLYGDILESELLGSAEFTIHPVKGQFVVFDKLAANLIGSIIFPVPTERTKGIILTRTIFGNVLIGPTAEEQEDRERATVDGKSLRMLRARASEIIPALKDIPVTAVYAGLRPATEIREYRIRYDAERQWITAGGIRSTGLTSALGIARYVFALYSGNEKRHAALEQPVSLKMPNLAEHSTRDWQEPGYGEIVCHCEMTTRREIEAAFSGPLPARDFGGLKRRTRAAMGRCQGLYCAARLADLSRGRLAEPLAVNGDFK
jgi:glycerol-3-phosphate dehydrogenase